MTAAEWVNGIIDRLINVVAWPVFVAAVVIMFFWIGFLFLTAKGEPGKLETARKALIWAVIGIIVGIIAFSAISTIKSILNITSVPSSISATEGACCYDDAQFGGIGMKCAETADQVGCDGYNGSFQGAGSRCSIVAC